MSGLIFHGGGIHAASQRYGGYPDEWLDLSTGINPCPPELPEIAPELWHRLPDVDVMNRARHVAADYYGSRVVLPIAAAGTQPLIAELANLADVEHLVAILSPTYGEYAQAFRSRGFDVDEIASLEEIVPEHRVVVIVNPNNPDGRIYSRADLLALALQLSATGAMLIVDEAFADLNPEVSLANVVEHNPHLVVLRSFGKFFGYAGLRLAYAIAGDDYAGRLRHAMGPWPVSGPALAISAALMRGPVEALRQTIISRRVALDAVLKGADLQAKGGTPLFALVETPKAASLFEHLAHNRILVRKFDYRPDWLRIGLFANDAQGERLAEALSTFEGQG